MNITGESVGIEGSSQFSLLACTKVINSLKISIHIVQTS